MVLGAGATAFVVAFLLGDLDDARVRRSGLHAVASVVDVDKPGKGPTTADIRFRTRAGDLVITTVNVDDVATLPQAGDEIDVRYRLDDPTGTAVTADVSRLKYWATRIVLAPLIVISSALPASFAAGLSLYRTEAGATPGRHLAPTRRRARPTPGEQ